MPPDPTSDYLAVNLITCKLGGHRYQADFDSICTDCGEVRETTATYIAAQMDAAMKLMNDKLMKDIYKNAPPF